MATASRVLNDSDHPVADATRAKVLAAAEDLDFVPNRLASSLAAQRSGTIGVIVHDVRDEYFAAIVRGTEEVARTRGCSVLVGNSERDPEREADYARTLRSLRADAVLFAGGGLRRGHARLERELEALGDAGAVVLRLAPHAGGAGDVAYSNRRGFRSLIDHLVDLGHRDLAYVAGPPGVATTQHRTRALRAALRAHGLTLADDAAVHGDFSREGGLRAGRQLLDAGLTATAVVAANDQLAIGLLRAFRDAGVRVPQDVSVTGFDDIPSCAYVAPTLTTVRIDLEELGRRGAQLAFARLHDPDAPPPDELPVELVVRESTGPPPDR